MAPPIDRQAALDQLFQVLAIDSTWGREKELAVALAAQFEGDGLTDVRLIEPVADRPSVVATIPGTGGGPSLILNGHIDTYEVSGDWTRDPFTPVIEDGRIYGSGVADEKAGTAALIAAARSFLPADRRPRGDIILMGVSAHFEGGLGTRAILESGVRADAGITCEPSLMQLNLAHRGAAYLTVTTHGKQAHTSARHLGLNAIDKIAVILQALAGHEVPHEPDELGGPIINVGTIHGGTKHNQVPDRCEISIDIRLPPSVQPEDARRSIEGLVETVRAADPDVHATVAFSPYWLSGPRHPSSTDPAAAIAKIATDALAANGSGNLQTAVLPVWSDMCVLNQAGIPSVNLGPGGPPYNWADEWVAVDEYLLAVAVFTDIIEEFCNRAHE